MEIYLQNRGVPWVVLLEQLGRSDDRLRGFGGRSPQPPEASSAVIKLSTPSDQHRFNEIAKIRMFSSPKI